MSARRRAAVTVREHATAAGYLLGWRMIRVLPERVALPAFRVAADRVHASNGRGVRRLRDNLARVCPEAGPTELEALVRDGVRSYFRYWCELFRLGSWTREEVARRTRVVGEPRVRAAYARGRGVVVALPHMANWDWAGAWTCAAGMPLMTVAERLEPGRLYDAFVTSRRALGMEVVPLGGDDAVFRRLTDWVRGGGLVCLLADRDLTRTGVPVRLCGEPARMPRGPAMLARVTGAALLPVTLHYEGGGLVITIHEEVPHAPGPDGLAGMTQGLADAFTAGLRAHPRDWHMMQQVFTEDPRSAGAV